MAVLGGIAISGVVRDQPQISEQSTPSNFLQAQSADVLSRVSVQSEFTSSTDPSKLTVAADLSVGFPSKQYFAF